MPPLFENNINHFLRPFFNGLLANKLSDWPIYTHDLVNIAGLTKKSLTLLDSSRQHLRKTAFIATTSGLPYAGRADVIIRAEGGLGWGSEISKDSLLALGICRLIIDFDDLFHPMLRSQSRRRKKAYKNNGWQIVGTIA
jgi:hypothetical protein